jgi:hypothetical protein
LQVGKVLETCVALCHSERPMRTLELDQAANGQWRYRVKNNDSTLVDWEWGTFEETETIKQAKDRFGKFNRIIMLDWI